MRKAMLLVLLMVALVASSMPARAATFPTKQINVMCMFGAGGVTDLVLRVVAEYAGKHGFAMNVINKPGGGGAQAGIEVKKARADGYTLLFASPSFITLTQMKNVGCTIDDFIPVAGVTEMYINFCLRSDSPIKSFGEWMELAQKEPAKFNYGSPGSISSQRMFMTKLLKEKFNSFALPHVPYQSGHDVNTALLGNHIAAAFTVPGVSMPYLKSGEFKMLAVSSEQRLPDFPNVPTFRELFGEQYYWTSFNGFFAPRNTPKDVVDALAKVIKEAMADPDVQAKMVKLAMPVVYKSPEAFAEDVKRMDTLTREALTDMKL